MQCRVGAVEFLNTVPLLRGLDDVPGLAVTCDVPSALAEGLSAGRYDVALIPVASYLQGVGDAIAPGVSISCQGAVGTIKLFAKRPLGEIRTLALDRGSRSSAGLARAALSARYGARPECREMEPDLGRMLEATDAALLIGQAGMLTEPPPEGAREHDLGEMWWDWQGVPLVLAAWVFAEGAASADVAAELSAARDRGLAALEEISLAEGERRGIDPAIIARYLGEMLDFSLGREHVEGMRRYQDLLIGEGLLAERRELTFAT